MVPDNALRILIIDDEDDWRLRIKLYAQLIGYDSESADSFENAVALLAEAERQQKPFSIAIIDMKFKTGMVETAVGTDILEYIKSEYPYIACIMATGSTDVDPLDLRDVYNLDSYIPKATFDKAVFAKKITEALKRVQSINKEDILQPPPQPEPEPASERQSLHQRLVQGCSREDLKEIIFYLGLSPGDIAGDTVSAIALNLILHCERHKCIDVLQNIIARSRPELG